MLWKIAQTNDSASNSGWREGNQGRIRRIIGVPLIISVRNDEATAHIENVNNFLYFANNSTLEFTF